LLETYPHAVWLNPQPEAYWEDIPSIQITRELMKNRMYPLTLEGLDRGIRELQRQTH
jgi:uncharacterized protein with von Willebrand factor type A (vWA) domain